MFNMLRIESTWDRVPENVNPALFKMYGGVTNVRLNNFDPTIAYLTMTGLHSEEWKGKFSHIASLGCRCLALQVVYGADAVGSLPLSFLQEQGFVPGEIGMWNLPHPDFAVSALPMKHQAKEWVLSFQKRSGSGIPMTVFDFMPHADRVQLTLQQVLEGRGTA